MGVSRHLVQGYLWHVALPQQISILKQCGVTERMFLGPSVLINVISVGSLCAILPLYFSHPFIQYTFILLPDVLGVGIVRKK